MERRNRLRSSAEWREVRRCGKCVGDRYCVVCVLRGTAEERFGFSTSKGFGTAVRRNKARRRLREAFLQVYEPDGLPRSITAVAQKAALEVEFAQLKSSLARQLQLLGVPVREER